MTIIHFPFQLFNQHKPQSNKISNNCKILLSKRQRTWLTPCSVIANQDRGLKDDLIEKEKMIKLHLTKNKFSISKLSSKFLRNSVFTNWTRLFVSTLYCPSPYNKRFSVGKVCHGTNYGAPRRQILCVLCMSKSCVWCVCKYVWRVCKYCDVYVKIVCEVYLKTCVVCLSKSCVVCMSISCVVCM